MRSNNGPLLSDGMASSSHWHQRLGDDKILATKNAMALRSKRHRAWSLVSRLNRTVVRLFVVVEIAERLAGRRMLDKPRSAHLISLVDLKLLAMWRNSPNPQIPRLVDNISPWGACDCSRQFIR
jgi:hypothetical protein